MVGELWATSESGSQSGFVAKTLAGPMKRPPPSTREPRVSLISLVTSLLVLLGLLPGVSLGLLDRFSGLEKWRLLKLELKKDKIDLSNGR